MWAAFLYVEWDGRLFAFPFGGIVEDFECAGVTELLFDVAYETHLGVFIGLDGESDKRAVGFDTCGNLALDKQRDVRDLGDLVVELDTGFGTVFFLHLAGHRSTHVDVAYEALLLELMVSVALGTLMDT